MTNVEALKETLFKQSEIFGKVGDDTDLYRAKMWYFMGIVSGFLAANCEKLTASEAVEINRYERELLQEA